MVDWTRRNDYQIAALNLTAAAQNLERDFDWEATDEGLKYWEAQQAHLHNLARQLNERTQ